MKPEVQRRALHGSFQFDAGNTSAGRPFAVAFGSNALTGKVKPGKIQTTSLGRVTLKAGNVPIALATLDPNGDELMRPRSLTLKTLNNENN